MPEVIDIIKKVETLSGHPLNSEEGIFSGLAEREIKSATICWMPTPDAITYAGERGDDLIITHESLYYPWEFMIETSPDWPQWKTNVQRRELLEKYDLTLLRIHGSADEICILDEFANVLGLGKPVFQKGFVKVYDIPETSLEDMIVNVKKRTGMRNIRYTSPKGMEQKLHRVGLPWGGMGLFVNVSYMQALMDNAVDLLIAGETDNYAFRFAYECGIPMIETSHEVSENPGLKAFTEILAENIQDVKFHYYENDCVWEMG